MTPCGICLCLTYFPWYDSLWLHLVWVLHLVWHSLGGIAADGALLKAECHSVTCRYHTLLIHPAVSRHLGCFCVLATVNGAVGNTGVQLPFKETKVWACAFLSSKDKKKSSVREFSHVPFVWKLCRPFHPGEVAQLRGASVPQECAFFLVLWWWFIVSNLRTPC